VSGGCGLAHTNDGISLCKFRAYRQQTATEFDPRDSFIEGVDSWIRWAGNLGLLPRLAGNATIQVPLSKIFTTPITHLIIAESPPPPAKKSAARHRRRFGIRLPLLANSVPAVFPSASGGEKTPKAFGRRLCICALFVPRLHRRGVCDPDGVDAPAVDGPQNKERFLWTNAASISDRGRSLEKPWPGHRGRVVVGGNFAEIAGTFNRLDSLRQIYPTGRHLQRRS